MLPPGLIANVMYEFVKKRVKKEYVTISYFLFSALCFLIVGMGIGVFMFLSKPTSIDAFLRFMSIAAVAMIVIGEIYALICWLIWLRKEN